MVPDFTTDERNRYSRHLLLPEVGETGQALLKAARVLVVGAGGLGAPALQYLAAAGMGTLGIADGDHVSLSNLQRQVLFSVKDIGHSKAEVAAARLRLLNPEIQVRVHAVFLEPDNVAEILSQYDLVLDGTDNFQTRYLLNDACYDLGLPLVYGSVFRFEGQVSVFNWLQPDGTRSPGYRDLYPQPPLPGEAPGCAEAGVLGVLPGIIGSLQAAEVLKIILHKGDVLAGKLWIYDLLTAHSRILRFYADPENPLRTEPAGYFRRVSYPAFCGIPDALPATAEWSPERVAEGLQTGGAVLVDVRTPAEYALGNIGSINIPLPELRQRLGDIPAGAPLILICRSGVRSAAAWKILASAGFSEHAHLAGGLLAWAARIQPDFPGL